MPQKLSALLTFRLHPPVRFPLLGFATTLQSSGGPILFFIVVYTIIQILSFTSSWVIHQRVNSKPSDLSEPVPGNVFRSY
jgi:hypothetical protein